MTADSPSPLADHLRRRIAREGPLSVADYMADSLTHPAWGYYATRDPLGADGDFTTAPEISQMFGELLGLWAAVVWRSMGAPDPVRLVELGPGRGTLMADALRAAAGVPDFCRAVRLHLVETSPVLRRLQGQALAGAAPRWHDDLSAVPEGPAILIANEFFDALPIRQFQRTADGWRERRVAVDEAGAFVFALARGAAEVELPAGPPGAIAEVGEAAAALSGGIAVRLCRDGGAALIVDYGHEGPGSGETLQAVRRHGFHGVLDNPGEADLTAHVDFGALARAARAATAHGPVPLGPFLEALGIGRRAKALLSGAGPGQAADIRAARHRLCAPAAMGHLFKVLALTAPGLPRPPGFPTGGGLRGRGEGLARGFPGDR